MLDIDPRDGGDETLAELEAEHGPLPATLTVKTSDGKHYYFTAPVGAPGRELGDGVSWRGDGLYVVLPPSVHPDGPRYQWANDLPIAPAPEWLLTATYGNGHRAEPIPEIIPKGRRNTTLASLAGSMRHRGMNEAVILAALRAVNEEQCWPPLDDEELCKIARSIGKYEPANDPTIHFSGDSGWPDEPGPLPETPAVPTLPTWMIPQQFRPWLVDAAERTCQPLEMVAVPALVAVGAVTGRTVAIRPNRFDDFTVVPNVWGGVVARPGWMKTQAVDEAMTSLKRLAAKARETAEAARAQEDVKRTILEAELDGLKKQMSTAAKKHENLTTFGAELAAKQRELKELRTPERRYYTNDATIEKLAELLRDNPRGLLVLRDELSGWLRTLDKPGREGDREFYLEAWNGTGSYTTDRIGRGTVHIPAHTIAICGGIQPGKISTFISDAMDGNAGDDGLLQRFQLLVWPDSLPAWKRPDRYPNREARNDALNIFGRLDTLTPLAIGATDDNERGVIPYLKFTPAAQTVWDDWRDALERRLRGTELADMPAFESHLAKYRSLMPALALLFHLVDHVAVGDKPERSNGVDEGSTRLAAVWCEFLELHARKVYGEETSPGVACAHALAAKIKAGGVKDGASVRDVCRHHWANLRTTHQVDQALEILCEAGWLRVESVATNGRPTEVIHLHTALRTEEKKS